jgi:2'-5' RNA ligase
LFAGAQATSPQEAGRPVAAANLHLTLAFLGDVSAEKQRALAQWPDVLPAGLRCTSTMPASGCVRAWSGWDAPAAARIIAAGEYAARPGGAQRLLSKPAAVSSAYHPLRDAGQAVAIPPPGFTGPFRSTTFALYESVFAQGRTRYTPLQRWTLGDTERNSDEV